MQKAYAQALGSLLKGGMAEEEAYKKLVTHLKARGRMKLLPELLRELKVVEARQRSRGPVLEVASEKEAKAAEQEARKEGITAKAVVNPSLVSGWRLTTADALTDRSGKRALIDLYRSITKV